MGGLYRLGEIYIFYWERLLIVGAHYYFQVCEKMTTENIRWIDALGDAVMPGEFWWMVGSFRQVTPCDLAGKDCVKCGMLKPDFACPELVFEVEP